MTETAAEIVARYGGAVGQADIAGFVGELETAQKLTTAFTVAGVFGPGAQDPLDAERGYRLNYFMTVGRHPTDLEVMGLPVWECDSCRRLSGTEPCDSHRRQLGTPIPFPADESSWPSRQPGHIPGTSIITRPGERRPNIVPWSHVRSVG